MRAGGNTSVGPLHLEADMRRNISGKHHARRFNKARSKYRAINNPSRILRGGTRL